jgi:hypothetical protein
MYPRCIAASLPAQVFPPLSPAEISNRALIDWQAHARIVLHYIAVMIVQHVNEKLDALAAQDRPRAVAFTYEGIDKRRRRRRKR